MTENKYRGKKIYHVIFNELITAARYRGYVTYQEIAMLMGLPLKGNYMGKELGQILGEISEAETQIGRPMLSAVAIGIGGSPGEGFYKLARDLGREFEDTLEGRRSFWDKGLLSVYKTWEREVKPEKMTL